MRSIPGLMLAASVGVVIAWTLSVLVMGCAATSHQDIELSAYSAEKSLCVKEASDFDAGQKCLDKVTAEYSQFWNVVIVDGDGGTIEASIEASK